MSCYFTSDNFNQIIIVIITPEPSHCVNKHKGHLHVGTQYKRRRDELHETVKHKFGNSIVFGRFRLSNNVVNMHCLKFFRRENEIKIEINMS